MRAVTRLRWARIALRCIALAYVVLLVSTWPSSPLVMRVGVLVLGCGGLLLSYKENPAAYHRRLGWGETARILLATFAILGVTLLAVIVLGSAHLS
jgi:hypothetical protein